MMIIDLVFFLENYQMNETKRNRNRTNDDDDDEKSINELWMGKNQIKAIRNECRIVFLDTNTHIRI
mgnify:CR=1 FL=1